MISPSFFAPAHMAAKPFNAHWNWTCWIYALLVVATVTCADAAKNRRRVLRSADPYYSPLNSSIVATKHGLRFKIGLIADLDSQSKVKNQETSEDEWISYLITGELYLNYNEDNLKEANMTIEWEEDEPQILKGNTSVCGRGMELSELITFDNHLLTCDDRTGIIFRLIPLPSNKNSTHHWDQIPWVTLKTGDGSSTKGFKCEWATVKNGNLWVGSHGTSPELAFVKEVTPSGHIEHHDWTANYKKISDAIGVKAPGYVTHEAVGWSDFHKKWVFIPRKVSSDGFDYKLDESKASNKIILADENFHTVELHGVAGELMPTHGVSSFKWLPLPGTNSSYIVAIKTEEIGEKQSTYILAFDMDGQILFPESKIDNVKYEGLEFL